MKLKTHSQQETMAFGEKLARRLKPGDILCLKGDLGTGKTTLVKGLAKGLGLKSTQVNSPTFVLMNIYEGKTDLYHFDLYRLEEVNQITVMGWEEFFYGDGVSVIEWAQRLGGLMPSEYLDIQLKHKGENVRELSITAKGDRYKKILKGLD
ncbi:MAG: tRNA (adenosine(37)-N6)-threonylcarbamoyltransferase complex ATPase subunit type 1 TsaE [Candidatus Omnitrophica bacterium]|nr:tRNA (adenosine(37)-N6)-threonylcarbamoyltransferase complex ATPase subunit type 1 TsaE [Candidatus Omnitrophota bacterium]